MQAGVENGGRNINNPRYADDTILIAESEEELKSLLRKVTEESEKAGLRPTFRLIHVNVWQKPPQCCKVICCQLNKFFLKDSTFKKLTSWYLVPSLHGKLMRKKWKQMTDSLFLDSKITAAMKLKDACSLEERL